MKKDPRTERTHKRLVRYAFSLGIAITLGLGLYLSGRDSTLTVAAKLSSLGLNLIAAAVFAGLFAFLTDREHEALVQEQIDSSLERQTQALIGEWRGLHRLYAPMDHYHAMPTFDVRFNRDLMGSLATSSSYFFRGVSAKYVPARLVVARHCPTSIHVVIPSPGSRASMRRRVADRLKNPKYATKSAEGLMEDLEREMMEALIALYDSRSYALIEVALSAETSVTRAEITDDAAFISWYHGPESPGQAFPETLRFSSPSFQYHVEKLNVIRTMELSERVLRFDHRVDEEQLCELLSELFRKEIAVADLEVFRKHYATQMSDFIAFLRHLG